MSAAGSHFSHWGAFTARVDGTGVLAVEPVADDPNPSPLLQNMPDAVRSAARVAQPMVRAGFLERGPGPDERRGTEPFVPVSWDEATELVAGELRRVIDTHGPAAVFGGSYGWGSAGRFHHAQSQVHRFLNVLGGYTRSVNTYSAGASEVILPHVVGLGHEVWEEATTWPVILDHTRLVVSFGGMPLKNAAVNPGGVTRHTVPDRLREAGRRGIEFVLVSPVADDLPEGLATEWIAPRPGSDVALMLALAHVLVVEDLHDRDFLERCSVGFERLRAYLMGEDDGEPKDPGWAESICGVPAGEIRALARRMAATRTLVTVSFSLQRSEHGEQPVWAALALAAVLGQIGLPGGGFGHGYGCFARIGSPRPALAPPTLPQGINPVGAFIPVARIADALLHPGEPFDYNGRRLRYPDLRLVYWCGGNPFHHHQDLARLRRALGRAETIVVHEPFWTAMARHADVVLPSTMTLERNDFGAAGNDRHLVAMHRVLEPMGQARDDYAAFAAIAERLGVGTAFTEDRDERAWLEHLYEGWRAAWAQRGVELPAFAAFWELGRVTLPTGERERTLFARFRADPVGSPLPTPSGRIELFSATIDAFGYADCPGHPVWLAPREWAHADRFPLALVANNPRTRLHSQLDGGAYSAASKVRGREPIRIHPADARARGITDGDVVRVASARGACLAGAVVSRAVRRGVVQLSTGAWYDPAEPTQLDALCVHGNVNVLTRDCGTSRLAQGCTGGHAQVEVERWRGPLPPVRAFEPPPLAPRSDQYRP